MLTSVTSETHCIRDTQMQASTSTVGLLVTSGSGGRVLAAPLHCMLLLQLQTIWCDSQQVWSCLDLSSSPCGRSTCESLFQTNIYYMHVPVKQVFTWFCFYICGAFGSIPSLWRKYITTKNTVYSMYLCLQTILQGTIWDYVCPTLSWVLF